VGAIGIDLGTTNSALAWTGARGSLRIFDVLQVVAPGETARHPVLPSFLYSTDQAQRESGAVALPWDASPDFVAGVFARDEGALAPSRQIASAKSWLSNPHVDRTAPLLPWGAEHVPTLSPVAASTRLLMHLRDAWNHERAIEDPAARLETLPVVLTVPASFDEEARELTVQAGRAAGLEHLTLLEEPLAALYAWMAAHRREIAATFAAGARILVCDVGGGTTDFSLIRAQADERHGEPTFERTAIGEHLLLGGDNLDLALAVLVEQKLAGAGRLSLAQRQMLRRQCSAAKERLLADASLERVPISILGAGRAVVAGHLATELTREDVVGALTSGFLPLTEPDDLPARDRRVGLRELGLPYETEPAITRHLAAFLTRAGGDAGEARMARPDAVLFNGGFFTPALARERILETLGRWFGRRPHVLEAPNPEAAVAAGAAFYGRLRGSPELSRRLLIRAGSSRTYYVGVGLEGQQPSAVCILTRGTEEGSAVTLDREFTVVANQPAAFTLHSSLDRSDTVGTVIALADVPGVTRHAPLVTAFRFGKRSRRPPLPVRLTTMFTEVGTLELWCASTTTDHRWRLAFNLRVGDEAIEEADEVETKAAPAVVVPEEAVVRAEGLVREVFGSSSSMRPPDTLVADLEIALGHGKQAWPLATIRRLADVLIELAGGRSRSPALEARWLNLTGFCMRPGFGGSTDAWRVSELRRTYVAGLSFPREIQNQVEWIVLWQRVGAGFTAGQQRELAQRMMGQLGLGQRKAVRLNPQIERESWRLLASLERLDRAQRASLGGHLLERIRRDPRNPSWLWSIGRLGARTPLYGPLNTVVAPTVAEHWIDRLLALEDLTADAAAAIVQVAARTGDAARDLSPDVVERIEGRLRSAGHDEAIDPLLRIVLPDAMTAGRVFGESLPEGLRLD